MENKAIHTKFAISKALKDFNDLTEPTLRHYERMNWAYDTIRTNFEEQSDYIPCVVQVSRHQALVLLVDSNTGRSLSFVLHCQNPCRMLTIMDFVYAVFMERTSETVKDVLRPLDFQEFCGILMRYTESAEYEKGCEVIAPEDSCL